MQFFQAHATQFVALHAPAKFALWPIVFFSVQRNKIWSKNVAATLQQNQISLILLQCCSNNFLVAEGDF